MNQMIPLKQNFLESINGMVGAKTKVPSELKIMHQVYRFYLRIMDGKHGAISKDKARLLNLLKNTKGASIIISGDRHSAEISRLDVVTDFHFRYYF